MSVVFYDHNKFIQELMNGRALVAADYALPFAEEDDPSAMVDMAQALRALDRELESRKWVARAEKLDRLDDPSYLLAMWHAFSLARLGGDSDDERKSKGFRFLKRLAEIGNVVAQENLMVAYFEGSNGAPQSYADFRHWAQMAKRAGSKLAAVYLESNKR
jgi:TPR repeat protein